MPARGILLLLLIMSLSGVALADQPFSGSIVASSRCLSCCIEGYPAEYIITVNNPYPYVYAIEEYWIQSVSGMIVNGTRFRNQNVRLGMHNYTTLTINANLPSSINNSFSFQACMIYNYTTDVFLPEEEEYCGSINVKTIYSRDIYFGVPICCSDSDCGANDYCMSNYTCGLLSCGSCEDIIDHRCVGYECCDDGYCNDTSTCVSNVCTPVPCDGVVIDRQCQSSIAGAFFDLMGFLTGNSAVLGVVIFIVIFLVVLLWFVRSGGEKGPEEKGGTKGKPKKGEKKGKEKKEGPEYVPLVELPK